MGSSIDEAVGGMDMAIGEPDGRGAVKDIPEIRRGAKK
jgi:hypothetical protein